MSHISWREDVARPTLPLCRCTGEVCLIGITREVILIVLHFIPRAPQLFIQRSNPAFPLSEIQVQREYRRRLDLAKNCNFLRRRLQFFRADGPGA